MPKGISIIPMLPKLPFKTVKELNNIIDAYFDFTQSEQETAVAPANEVNEKPVKKTIKKQAQPPTIAGLALYIGFVSRQEFDHHEAKGKFSASLKKARLRIEAEYEKKLHIQSSTGAIFALKSMGWNERQEKDSPAADSGVFTVQIVDSGPRLASAESEVII
jgi:hypothetical protein